MSVQNPRYAAAVLFPMRAALQKELGKALVASGLVGEAMAIFERLEIWDSLLVCYRLLDKKAQALTLIRARLEVYLCILHSCIF